MRAEGVYIPKEQDSITINQFRPISLLDVKGKIFFSVMAARLTIYLLQKQSTSIHSPEGRHPRSAKLSRACDHDLGWDPESQAGRKDLDIVWLDQANAYGSIPHEMTQVSLQTYHVSLNIREMLKTYFNGVLRRFSTKEYTTSWIDLGIGIAMGCAISLILFVLAMVVIHPECSSK